jgi:serine/threonine-protein kinase RsbW
MKGDRAVGGGGQESPLELELPAVPTSIARARRAVVAFGQRFQADTDKLALATSEAVTNVVRHAYRGDRHGPVRLTAEFDGSDIVVEVSDGGIGMVPHPESDGLGLGLPLIGAMASEVKLDSSPPGLSVLMRFPCPEAG